MENFDGRHHANYSYCGYCYSIFPSFLYQIELIKTVLLILPTNSTALESSDMLIY